jgi:hypothetical protein
LKIISPFIDYYDTAVFEGHDPHLLYIRKPEIKNVTTSVYWASVRQIMAIPSWQRRDNGGLPEYHKIFGFAGRIFMLAFKLSGPYGREVIDSVEPSEITNKYSNDEIVRLFNEYGPAWIKCGITSGEMPQFNRMDDRISRYNLMGYHQIYKEVVISNPSMRFCYLQHLLSPAEAYIEMERFTSNIARPEKPQMGNDIKIEQHGFDRFSFRSNKGQRP